MSVPPANPEDVAWDTQPANRVIGYQSGMLTTGGGSRGFIGARQSIGVQKTHNVVIGHNGVESTVLEEPRVFSRDNLTLSIFNQE